VSADHDTDQWLTAKGFALPEARRVARAALEEARLTRPGKQRFSDEKIARFEELLRTRFFLHCEQEECRAAAKSSGRIVVRCDPKAACERCGGSANAAAESEFIAVCASAGVRRVVIVGGSPSVRSELEHGIGQRVELRMIDGTERRTLDRAKSDLEWADLILVWGASELDHKVSTLYTQAPPPHRRKVVNVARRGVAALLAEGVRHLGGR
jgi:hypothetical protein